MTEAAGDKTPGTWKMDACANVGSALFCRRGTARGDVSVRRAQDRVKLPDLTGLQWYLAREVVDEIVRCARRGFVMRWKAVAMRAHNVGRGASSRCGRAQSQTEHQRRRALSEHSKSTCAALIHGRKRLRCGESVIGADRAAHRRKVGEQEEVVEERRRRCGARDRGASGRAVPPLPSSDRHPGARCAVRVCTTACPARAATAGESEGRGGDGRGETRESIKR